jgi:putative glycerol-1-phosphate prenyltransferase
MKLVREKFIEARKKNQKLLAVLIDPDKFFDNKIVDIINENKVDLILVGGSILTHGNLDDSIQQIKSMSQVPVIIFPGNASHISTYADAILILSLISGRNPEYLISQHVQAAPILSKSNLETISVSYILINGGNQTSVAYISNTTPIPSDKPELALATALAGELIGHQLIYLEAGSGALQHVDEKTISLIKSNTQNPIIVGGGIRDATTAKSLWNAGADCIVIGNAAEENAAIIKEIAAIR